MKDIQRAIEAVGGLPVVVKVTQGTQGQGVFLRHTIRETTNLVQGLLVTGKAVLIQEYVAESHGKDIRALVVGGKVVACMRRRGKRQRIPLRIITSMEPSKKWIFQKNMQRLHAVRLGNPWTQCCRCRFA